MTAVLHVELVDQTQTALELRLWSDNPNAVRTRTLGLSELTPLIEKAETDYYSPLPARLVEIGRTLFRWLDGGERWLTREIQAATSSPVVLCISTPKGLAHLPWEALHNGDGFLVRALGQPVLPVRWLGKPVAQRTPAPRPLQVLFMASSPQNVHPVLDFEGEENAILTATRPFGLDLLVEESGCVDELGLLMQQYDEHDFDVLHITGHAEHTKAGEPVFLLEDSEGMSEEITAQDLARALPHRPPLVFLSGCRTGQNAAHGEVRSLAEQMLDAGFRVVLGWGKPVRDTDATLAAQLVYSQLAAGESLPSAIVRTHAQLQEAGARDWHLLRLFCAGDPPAAFVTRTRSPGRRHLPTRAAEDAFLDPLTKKVKVATRGQFVGRRRLLQRSVRRLRDAQSTRAGLLLHGQGGRGKSSVAARLCDRLRREYQRIVVIGRLDETSLANAWAPELPDDDARRALRGEGELRYRIEAQLRRSLDAGKLAPLFVLDDFEQNQPNAETGDLSLAPHAASTLLALLEAMQHAQIGRVLITCRYAVPALFGDWLESERVEPLDPTEQQKQLLRLDQKANLKERDPDLTKAAQAAADGNPRLAERLHALLAQPSLDHAEIIARMRAAEEKFRGEIAARSLISTLPEDDRVLLGRMLMLTLPVPLAAVHALAPSRADADLRAALTRASDRSLLDITGEDGEPHYRVPQQLAGGDPPLLPAPTEEELATLAGSACGVLFARWWGETGSGNDSRALQLIHLAVAGGRTEMLLRVAKETTSRWLFVDRYRETRDVLEGVLEPANRHHALLLNLARAVGSLGDGDAAGAMLREASLTCPAGGDDDRASILFHFADWLVGRGETEQALTIYRDDLLPILAKSGDVHSRAVTLGRIADVLYARGELDAALRIRREEQLPVYERLGDVRSRAVTLGKIADVLYARGELDEALRIRREEELPVYERLGDVRERAVTLGKIADMLYTRGELDEALRIRREEELPVYERLGDVRSRAVTLGQIADVLYARGELDEALRIRREEELPVYERLGDVRSRAVTLGKIADVLYARGELDAALRIRREEQLPVYERLGDVRSRAVTLGQIADVLYARGEVDEALRIRREEQLPVYERLGDVRSRAVTLGKIADVLYARGELDAALRIRREEQLPVLRTSGRRALARGDVGADRGRAVCARRGGRGAAHPARGATARVRAFG